MHRTITHTVLDEAPECPFQRGDNVAVALPDGDAYGTVFDRPRKLYQRRGARWEPVILVSVHLNGSGTASRGRLRALCCAVRDFYPHQIRPR